MIYDDNFLELIMQGLHDDLEKFIRHPELWSEHIDLYDPTNKLDFFLWQVEIQFALPQFYFDRKRLKEIALTSNSVQDFDTYLIDQVLEFHGSTK